jgi:hypothetical protein
MKKNEFHELADQFLADQGRWEGGAGKRNVGEDRGGRLTLRMYDSVSAILACRCGVALCASPNMDYCAEPGNAFIFGGRGLGMPMPTKFVWGTAHSSTTP